LRRWLKNDFLNWRCAARSADVDLPVLSPHHLKPV